MENPIKMDDLGVPPFKETPIYSMVPETFLTFPGLTMDRQITDGFFLVEKIAWFVPLPVDIHMDSA